MGLGGILPLSPALLGVELIIEAAETDTVLRLDFIIYSYWLVITDDRDEDASSLPISNPFTDALPEFETFGESPKLLTLRNPLADLALTILDVFRFCMPRGCDKLLSLIELYIS